MTALGALFSFMFTTGEVALLALAGKQSHFITCAKAPFEPILIRGHQIRLKFRLND